MTAKEYCAHSDRAILIDIITNTLPINVMEDDDAWSHVSAVWFRHQREVETWEPWQRVCRTRGATANIKRRPAGY